MDLYDVSADGFHTPLSKAEIANLFRAGRLNRNHPCKLSATRDWRTIDELFPLLKHEAIEYSSRPSPRVSSINATFNILLAVLITLALCAIAALCLWKETPSPIVAQSPLKQELITSELSKPAQPYEIESIRVKQDRSVPTRANGEAERRAAEGRRLLKAANEQLAAANQRRAESDRQQKEADRVNGKDYRVPLDQDYLVPMNGGNASVRIHDNDVTSFDVWVNGRFSQAVPKQKGMTYSRTDETLIYTNGRSSLYFVWQISGKLNHCLLRVRDN